MISTNSRNKGLRGERELAQVLRNAGLPAATSNQWRTGGTGHPDVSGIDGFHLEVKRTEKLELHRAFRQAERDADGAKPAVAHRMNREPWLLTLRMDDFLSLYMENRNLKTTIRELARMIGGDSGVEGD